MLNTTRSSHNRAMDSDTSLPRFALLLERVIADV